MSVPVGVLFGFELTANPFSTHLEMDGGTREGGDQVGANIGGAGIGWDDVPAGPASTATLHLDGKVTKGKLMVAVYVPTS